MVKPEGAVYIPEWCHIAVGCLVIKAFLLFEKKGDSLVRPVPYI